MHHYDRMKDNGHNFQFNNEILKLTKILFQWIKLIITEMLNEYQSTV